MSCATFFVALQCYECSTMQVKQRKNGSNINNKWTCVVCNQKQSVRKVFAQGPMAKDLRLFVQSFNMSRAQSQSQSQSQSQTFHLNHNEEPPLDLSSQIMTLKRPQTDWSQYLDNSEDDFQSKFDQQQQKSGDEFEPKIITELFKKPKLNKTYVSSDSEGGTGVKQLHKPVFSKRKLNVNATCPEQPRGFKSTTNSKKEEVETNECKMTLLKTKKTSKWDDCITGDDDVLAVRVFPGRVGDHGFDCSNDMLAELTDDEVVEDEIHSDFM